MKRLHILLSRPTGMTPALARLLARGRRHGTSTPGPTAALARLFRLEPAALPPVLLAAEGIEPGTGPWFRADPVHMLAGMHSISLLDVRHFELGQDEAAALVASLNTHFAGKMAFFAPHPTRWYVRLTAAIEVDIPPLDQVIREPIAPDLVGGPDAPRLQGLAMEIQMLLHDHPVNEAREERGELPVNGVWLWGGALPSAPQTPFDRVLSRSFTGSALARAAGIPCDPPAGQLDSRADVVLLELDPETDAELIQAVLAALQRWQLEEVVIELPGTDEPSRRLTPWSAWKIWLKRPPGPAD